MLSPDTPSAFYININGIEGPLDCGRGFDAASSDRVHLQEFRQAIPSPDAFSPREVPKRNDGGVKPSSSLTKLLAGDCSKSQKAGGGGGNASMESFSQQQQQQQQVLQSESSVFDRRSWASLSELDAQYSSDEEDLAGAAASSFNCFGGSGAKDILHKEAADVEESHSRNSRSSNHSRHSSIGNGIVKSSDSRDGSGHSLVSLSGAFSCQDLINAVIDFDQHEHEQQHKGIDAAMRASATKLESVAHTPPPRQPIAVAAKAQEVEASCNSMSHTPPARLRLLAAEEDGTLMDDLPELSLSTDVAAMGITNFVVVDSLNNQQLMHVRVEEHDAIYSESSLTDMDSAQGHSHTPPIRTPPIPMLIPRQVGGGSMSEAEIALRTSSAKQHGVASGGGAGSSLLGGQSYDSASGSLREFRASLESTMSLREHERAQQAEGGGGGGVVGGELSFSSVASVATNNSNLHNPLLAQMFEEGDTRKGQWLETSPLRFSPYSSCDQEEEREEEEDDDESADDYIGPGGKGFPRQRHRGDASSSNITISCRKPGSTEWSVATTVSFPNLPGGGGGGGDSTTNASSESGSTVADHPPVARTSRSMHGDELGAMIDAAKQQQDVLMTRTHALKDSLQHKHQHHQQSHQRSLPRSGSSLSSSDDSSSSDDDSDVDGVIGWRRVDSISPLPATSSSSSSTTSYLRRDAAISGPFNFKSSSAR